MNADAFVPGGGDNEVPTQSRVCEVLLERSEIVKWLAELKTEHRDLDEIVVYLVRTDYPDSMRIQRLKKRKLKLRDMITKLESQLIPDLDA